MEPVEPLTDAHLTRRAQAGETGALGLLLARHQAPMRAVALSLLGHGPDAEDVVQDAALTALHRIGDVRDPDAVGAWLRAVVRNTARMRLRSTREIPGLTALDHLHVHPDDEHERRIEQHALRDWIWDAIGSLPPKLRLVVMLRYFSPVASYEEIAAACDIPLGTVRSRLNQARTKLARLLLDTAQASHDDADRRTEESRQEALATLAGWESGTLPREISNLWPSHSAMTGRLGRPGEHVHPVPVMRGYLEDGVRQQLRRVVAGRDIDIWEMDVTTAQGALHHCPPTLSWLMLRRDGRVQQLRVVYPKAHALAPA
ncbi:sigma-70 family RNA polymerase sigma factor [Streptomyces sp. NPDC048295]|uniref:RNA polymerase sigma factor n=1 Tax=Streptomyces sp. NPDC048295 TaxID=3154617 RepID=UPI0034222BEB